MKEEERESFRKVPISKGLSDDLHNVVGAVQLDADYLADLTTVLRTGLKVYLQAEISQTNNGWEVLAFDFVSESACPKSTSEW